MERLQNMINDCKEVLEKMDQYHSRRDSLESLYRELSKLKFNARHSTDESMRVDIIETMKPYDIIYS